MSSQLGFAAKRAGIASIVNLRADHRNGTLHPDVHTVFDELVVAGHEVGDGGQGLRRGDGSFGGRMEVRPTIRRAERPVRCSTVMPRCLRKAVARLVERCQRRPIAQVAAGMGISRQCASKWVNRYRKYGEAGLVDRPSVPHNQPTATPAQVVVRIEAMRREHKWSARRISIELAGEGVTVSVRTLTRHLAHLGLNRRRFLDPTGENNHPLGSAVGAWMSGHWHSPSARRKAMVPLAVVSGLVLVPSAARPDLIFSFALWAVCGACSTVFLIQAQAVLTQPVPDSRRVAVLGLASGGLQASQGLAVLAVGLLSQHVGVYWAVGGAGAAIAVLAVFLGLMWRRVRPGPELARRARAEQEAWLGEVESIDLTLTYLRQKREKTKRWPHRTSRSRHTRHRSAAMTWSPAEPDRRTPASRL